MRLKNLLATLMVLAALMPSIQACADEERGRPPALFAVSGLVQTPRTITMRDLRKLPSTQENITYYGAGKLNIQAFTGVLLWDLLNSLGIVLDPAVKNDILRKVVVVTGTDGYKSVFALGEIAPGFGGNQVMVAVAADGLPLDTQGPARIAVPTDKMGGRFVSNIATIEIRSE